MSGPIETALLGELADPLVAVDTETTGLRWWAGDRPFLVGAMSSGGRAELVRVPPDARAYVGDFPGVPALASLLEDRRVTKLFFNAKFDLHMLREAGLRVRGHVEDAYLHAKLSGLPVRKFSLKSLAREVLRLETPDEAGLKAWLAAERRRRRKAAVAAGAAYAEPNYSDVPAEIIEPYLRMDLEYTLRLRFALRPRLEREQPALLRLEERLIRPIVAMERRGIKIDRQYFRQAEKAAEKEMAEAQRDAHAAGSAVFDLLSSKQLGEILVGRLGQPVRGRTKSGAPSFDKETLPLYDHPLARAVLRYRRAHKLSATYYRGLLKAADKRGIVHCSLNQLVDNSPRMSCREPNLQNLPAHE